MMMDRRNRNITVGCIVGAAVLVGMFNFSSNTVSYSIDFYFLHVLCCRAICKPMYKLPALQCLVHIICSSSPPLDIPSYHTHTSYKTNSHYSKNQPKYNHPNQPSVNQKDLSRSQHHQILKHNVVYHSAQVMASVSGKPPTTSYPMTLLSTRHSSQASPPVINV